MANDFTTGTLWQSSIPNWQRIYYEGLLMETLRTKSIMVPYTVMKEDFAAKKTGIINYTEVYDTEPNWNAITEKDLWLAGAHLDSRSQTINLEVHGDTLKFSDYSEITTYINNGDIRGLVREKIGQNLTDTLDILARNAFLAHPYPIYAGGTRANRAAITSSDLFDPDLAELARTHLEEHEVPGVVTVDDSAQTIACVTTPRVIHDIRTAAGTAWIEAQQYAGNARKFNGEVGLWNGVRFVRTNRLVMRNYGAVSQQTTLAADAHKGEGAAAVVDTIYNVGRDPNAKRYITVAENGTNFVVGDYITIHSQAVGVAGDAPVEADGTQETRRIVAVSGTLNVNLALDKPLLKEHASGDYVTKGLTLHASLFMGGPSVVFGVAERPTPILPPKFDDLMMINRIGWRGMFKFQTFRPEFFEVHFTAGSTN